MGQAQRCHFWGEKTPRADTLISRQETYLNYGIPPKKFKQNSGILLLEKLDSYQPFNETEMESAKKIRAFVSTHPECFERTYLEGHVTGSAWVVDTTGKRVLLTHHRKLNLWLQLGGHADGDPDTFRVALREAEEESGIKNLVPASKNIFDLDVHPIPAREKEPAHFHYDIRFAFRAPENEFTVGEESHDLAWIDIDRIAERTTEASMLRMALKWKTFFGR